MERETWFLSVVLTGVEGLGTEENLLVELESVTRTAALRDLTIRDGPFVGASGEKGGEHLMNWREYITVDPEICHGKACISGTRVLVTTVLDNLADGLDADEITRSYPSVSREAVRAALCYAAALANERFVAFQE